MKGEPADKTQSAEIAEFLVKSYLDAMMRGDEATMVGVSRALAALMSNPALSAYEIFTRHFIDAYETNIYVDSVDAVFPHIITVEQLRDGELFAGEWPPSPESVFKRICRSVVGEPGSVLVESLKDGGRGLVHSDEFVYPLNCKAIAALHNLEVIT